MSPNIYNFSAGPAVLPEPVLRRAQNELLSLSGSGVSVMEISHRSGEFEEILASAISGIRENLNIPPSFEVLFLQGGASLQFSMVPMNFASSARLGEYVVTGYWGEKAAREAERLGFGRTVYSTATEKYRSIPQPSEINTSRDAAYVHYTSNETIDGVEFDYDLDLGGGAPVVCDASSNILSKPIDLEKYDLIYAGAQKNIGPSGVTVVIVRREMLERVPGGLPPLLDYRNIASNGSMPNTPNTWGIYLIDLVCRWLHDEGGVEAMRQRNAKKADLLYQAIDASDGFYAGHANRAARSRMNVTFHLPSDILDKAFCSEAAAAGLVGLKGHRAVGGIRASIYNAFPFAGVEALANFMKAFAATNG